MALSAIMAHIYLTGMIPVSATSSKYGTPKQIEAPHPLSLTSAGPFASLAEALAALLSPRGFLARLAADPLKSQPSRFAFDLISPYAGYAGSEDALSWF